jgi:DNA replication protein DnaC
MLCQ